MEAIKSYREIYQEGDEKRMYRIPKYSKGTMEVNQSTTGEPIEVKIERIVNNKEPIKQGDGAPPIYTDRKEGVRASTNIRTDRFEVAIDATDKIAKSYKAKREERAKEPEAKKEGEAQSIQADPTTGKPKA